LVDESMGYAESALLEPWGCVAAAYTQRRRLDPKTGGKLWVIGQPSDTTEFTFSEGLDAPATIILTDVPSSIKQLVHATKAEVIEKNDLTTNDYEAINRELTDGKGFDDI